MARTARLKILTAAAVKAYNEDPSKSGPLHDGGGLYLRKREASARWYLRTSNPATGAEQWHLMFPDDPAGGYPHKTLAMARDEADRLRSIRSQGFDPRAERQRGILERQQAMAELQEQERRLITVRQLFEQWAATDLAPHVGADGKRVGRKDGGRYAREQFERRVFPRLGSLALANVRKADLLAILDATKAEGKLRTANVLLADLKQMLRFARVRDLIERDPLETVTKRDAGGAEASRDRVLTVEELHALAKAIPEARMAPRSVAAVWLVLSTACRVGEAMGARWSDVDLQARTWHLPDTKNQRDHTIHLSAFAMRWMEELASIRDAETEARDKARSQALADGREAGPEVQQSPWLFPDSDFVGPVCVKSFGKQLADRQRPPAKRMSGRSNRTESLLLPGGKWTAHDLRRTAATLMAEAGISGDVIDECLNHVIESRVRRTYIRDRRLADQARAFDVLGARLAAIASGEVPNTNVVALRSAA